MRRVFRVSIALVAFSPASVTGQSPAATRIPAAIVVSAYSSVSNSYTRGNVDAFVQYQSGDPDQKADAGSTAFYGFEGVYVFKRERLDDPAFGAGLQFQKAADHAIWTTIFFPSGGGADLAFELWQLNVIGQMRMRVYGNADVVFEPGVDMGFMTGHYMSGCCSSTYYDAAAVGFHAASGMDTWVGRSLGLTFRAGYRSLQVPASYPDDASSTGYSQTLCCGSGSDPMVVNWSGWYFTFSFSYRINRGKTASGLSAAPRRPTRP